MSTLRLTLTFSGRPFLGCAYVCHVGFIQQTTVFNVILSNLLWNASPFWAQNARFTAPGITRMMIHKDCFPLSNMIQLSADVFGD